MKTQLLFKFRVLLTLYKLYPPPLNLIIIFDLQMLKYAKNILINNFKEKLNMKGYGIASWIKKEEYRNYFITANYQPEADGQAYK